jgi:hypothetical protein
MYSQSISFCGLVYGASEHHIDHLAPLCALLDIPLVVTEEKLETLVKKYYPQLVVFYYSYIEAPQKLISNLDAIFTALPSPLFDSIFSFSKRLQKKDILTIWCPHGNSDKGIHSSYFEALNEEKALIIYGKKMEELFLEKKAIGSQAHLLYVGNYRAFFYEKHKTLYKKLTEKEIFSKLPKENQTILYAPTWEDDKDQISLNYALKFLLDHIPEDLNLIIKLHPNTCSKEDVKLMHLLLKYETKKNVLILEDFPLIYPLLSCVDFFIGDTSSIGYDFLYFNKPMFFLKKGSSSFKLPLHQCGKIFDEEHLQDLLEEIEFGADEPELTQIRKKLYDFTFYSYDPSIDLINTLTKLYKSL